MAKPNVSLSVIENFLAQKRIAMVGMPRERSQDTMLLYQLFQELCRRGHEVLPVNPNVLELTPDFLVTNHWPLATCLR
jgi:predicted CoA-binding protein